LASLADSASGPRSVVVKSSASPTTASAIALTTKTAAVSDALEANEKSSGRERVDSRRIGER
jgi:hypothetical protein